MKYSGMKKALALALAVVMSLSMLSVGTLAAEEAPAVSLMEGNMLLLPVEEVTAPVGEEAPVMEAAPAAETPVEELPAVEETAGDEVLRASYINPLYADRISQEHLFWPEMVAMDGATASFSTPAALGAYMRQQMVAREETITFYYGGDFDDILGVAMDSFALAHTGKPKEGDSLAYQFGACSAQSSGGYVTLGIVYYTTADQEAATDAKVESLMASLDLPRATDYETVKAVHDYLCNTVTYTEDYEAAEAMGDNTPWSTYGALVERDCVCQGYALAVYRLLLECGIDCRIISGYAVGPHAWNIVQLGDYYYSLDATWDDQEEYGIYDDWFLRGKTAFYQDHTPQDEHAWSSSFWDDYPMSLTDYDPSNPDSGVVEDTGGSTGGTGDTDGIAVTAENFPDENFRNYVSWYIDLSGNGYLSQEEIGYVTELNVSEWDIESLAGVEYFADLEFLVCYNNYITELDVSGFENLMYLDVSGNGMERLTLGRQETLVALYCENNSLTELDITGCGSLYWMWCHNNALETLDLSGNPLMEELSCYDNYIEALDVSPCPVLVDLVENVAPAYYYDYGIVDYYYQVDEENYYDLSTDIGVMIYTQPRRGDVNADGYINTADAMLVLYHAVGTGLLTGDAATEADVNFDEVIDARDATQILRYWNNLISAIG